MAKREKGGGGKGESKDKNGKKGKEKAPQSPLERIQKQERDIAAAIAEAEALHTEITKTQGKYKGDPTVFTPLHERCTRLKARVDIIGRKVVNLKDAIYRSSDVDLKKEIREKLNSDLNKIQGEIGAAKGRINDLQRALNNEFELARFVGPAAAREVAKNLKKEHWSRKSITEITKYTDKEKKTEVSDRVKTINDEWILLNDNTIIRKAELKLPPAQRTASTDIVKIMQELNNRFQVYDTVKDAISGNLKAVIDFAAWHKWYGEQLRKKPVNSDTATEEYAKNYEAQVRTQGWTEDELDLNKISPYLGYTYQEIEQRKDSGMEERLAKLEKGEDTASDKRLKELRQKATTVETLREEKIPAATTRLEEIRAQFLTGTPIEAGTPITKELLHKLNETQKEWKSTYEQYKTVTSVGVPQGYSTSTSDYDYLNQQVKASVEAKSSLQALHLEEKIKELKKKHNALEEAWTEAKKLEVDLKAWQERVQSHDITRTNLEQQIAFDKQAMEQIQNIQRLQQKYAQADRDLATAYLSMVTTNPSAALKFENIPPNPATLPDTVTIDREAYILAYNRYHQKQSELKRAAIAFHDFFEAGPKYKQEQRLARENALREKIKIKLREVDTKLQERDKAASGDAAVMQAELIVLDQYKFKEELGKEGQEMLQAIDDWQTHRIQLLQQDAGLGVSPDKLQAEFDRINASTESLNTTAPEALFDKFVEEFSQSRSAVFGEDFNDYLHDINEKMLEIYDKYEEEGHTDPEEFFRTEFLAATKNLSSPETHGSRQLDDYVYAFALLQWREENETEVVSDPETLRLVTAIDQQITATRAVFVNSFNKESLKQHSHDAQYWLKSIVEKAKRKNKEELQHILAGVRDLNDETLELIRVIQGKAELQISGDAIIQSQFEGFTKRCEDLFNGNYDNFSEPEAPQVDKDNLESGQQKGLLDALNAFESAYQRLLNEKDEIKKLTQLRNFVTNRFLMKWPHTDNFAGMVADLEELVDNVSESRDDKRGKTKAHEAATTAFKDFINDPNKLSPDGGFPPGKFVSKAEIAIPAADLTKAKDAVSSAETFLLALDLKTIPTGESAFLKSLQKLATNSKNLPEDINHQLQIFSIDLVAKLREGEDPDPNGSVYLLTSDLEDALEFKASPTIVSTLAIQLQAYLIWQEGAKKSPKENDPSEVLKDLKSINIFSKKQIKAETKNLAEYYQFVEAENKIYELDEDGNRIPDSDLTLEEMIKQRIDDIIKSPYYGSMAEAMTQAKSGKKCQLLLEIAALERLTTQDDLPTQLSEIKEEEDDEQIEFFKNLKDRLDSLALASKNPLNGSTPEAHWELFKTLGKDSDEYIAEAPVKKVIDVLSQFAIGSIESSYNKATLKVLAKSYKNLYLSLQKSTHTDKGTSTTDEQLVTIKAEVSKLAPMLKGYADFFKELSE